MAETSDLQNTQFVVEHLLQHKIVWDTDFVRISKYSANKLKVSMMQSDGYFFKPFILYLIYGDLVNCKL